MDAPGLYELVAKQVPALIVFAGVVIYLIKLFLTHIKEESKANREVIEQQGEANRTVIENNTEAVNELKTEVRVGNSVSETQIELMSKKVIEQLKDELKGD